jgi:hypothetical protein
MTAAYLRRRRPAAAVYVARGVAAGDIVPGISDIDIAVVVPDDPDGELAEHRRIRARLDRLDRRLPLGRRLVPDVAVYEDADLRACASASILTYGLSDATAPALAPAAMFGTAAPHDEFELRARPGLAGPTRDWRRIAGPERRPRPAPRDRQQQRLAAWLELQFWWRSTFYACANPARPWAAYMCVKMVAEPARILLSLAGHAAHESREQILISAAGAIPEEEVAFSRALELLHELPRSPAAPLAEFVPDLARLSARLARLLEEEISGAGYTEVHLVGADLGAAGGGLPLSDWRAVAIPSMPDEELAPVEGGGASPESLIAAAALGAPGVQPAIREDELLVLPLADRWLHGLCRSVQATFSDPVSFALLAGGETARFPDLSGWSARDWAGRAVAEHAAWLRRGPGKLGEPSLREWLDGTGDGTPPLTRALAKLLTALRAGLFLQSLQQGSPTLAVTVGAAARELEASNRGPSAAAEAAEAYRRAREEHRQPSPDVVDALRELVLAMPAYAAIGTGR